MTAQPGRCQTPSCRAPLLWVTSAAKGKPMCLDPEPVEGGNVRVVDGVGHVLGPIDVLLAAGEPLYLDHHATCTDPDYWKERAKAKNKARDRTAPSAPKTPRTTRWGET